MFGLTALDVAIGLVFVYLLLGLVCSAVRELMAGAFDARSKGLAIGIHNLLDDPAVQGLEQRLFSHPLIQSLRSGDRPPSYIPARTFALTIIDVLAPLKAGQPRTIDDVHRAVAALPDALGVKRTMLVLLNEAEYDLTRFEHQVQWWYGQAMERVSGRYKNRTQFIIMAIALAVTAMVNADTIAIANAFVRNPALRERVVQQATDFAAAHPAGVAVDTAAYMAGAAKLLGQTSVPLGWRVTDLPQGGAWLTKLFGLLVTALAVSLGAPFWFDMLNKIITIRSTGRTPVEAAKAPPTPDAA